MTAPSAAGSDPELAALTDEQLVAAWWAAMRSGGDETSTWQMALVRAQTFVAALPGAALPARSDALDWRICRLHGRAQDDPNHEYKYPDCENAGYDSARSDAGLRTALDDVSKAYGQHRQGKLGPTGVSYALHVAEDALRAALAAADHGSPGAGLDVASAAIEATDELPDDAPDPSAWEKHSLYASGWIDRAAALRMYVEDRAAATPPPTEPA